MSVVFDCVRMSAPSEVASLFLCSTGSKARDESRVLEGRRVISKSPSALSGQTWCDSHESGTTTRQLIGILMVKFVWRRERDINDRMFYFLRLYFYFIYIFCYKQRGAGNQILGGAR